MVDNEDATAQPIPLGVGDEVTWTHTKSNGDSFNFSTRNGKIMEICGKRAVVRMRNGRRDNIALIRLRREGERTALTEAFMDMADTAKVAPAADTPARSISGLMEMLRRLDAAVPKGEGGVMLKLCSDLSGRIELDMWGCTVAGGQLGEPLVMDLGTVIRANPDWKPDIEALVATLNSIMESGPVAVTEPAPKWRRPETAPKDGNKILIDEEDFGVIIAYWNRSQQLWEVKCPTSGNVLSGHLVPLGWIPLPVGHEG